MELFKHQIEGIEFLDKTRRAILADEMGLGKTRQAIMVSGNIQRTEAKPEDIKGVLVICPASLKINWYREIKMIYPDDEVFAIKPGTEIELPSCPWLIINYDMLQKYAVQIMKKIEDGEIGIAIIDEAHYIKGRKTIRSEMVLAITNMLEVVYLLTGTPIMNRPRELFNLLKAIKHPLGSAVTTFAKRYCGAYMKTIIKKNGMMIRFFDDKGATHLEELREFTKDSILRRLKKDVLDLPEKIISVQITEMTKEWKKKYDNAFDEYMEWVINNPSEFRNAENIIDARHLVEIIKIKQVCSMAKIERIVEDIRSAVEQGQKVIVFSQFTGTIMKIREELMQEKRGTRYGDAIEPIKSVVLTGQNTMNERQASVDAFQNDEDTKVFIANIKAGGVGITLTKASIVMFADMEWSPELHSQAEDRAHRIGQTGTVNVYYYIAEDTIDEDIVEILENKKKIIRQIMDGDQGHKYAEELERIRAIDDDAVRTVAYDHLMKEMSKGSDIHTISMASEFLERMKKKLHIHN